MVSLGKFQASPTRAFVDLSWNIRRGSGNGFALSRQIFRGPELLILTGERALTGSQKRSTRRFYTLLKQLSEIQSIFDLVRHRYFYQTISALSWSRRHGNHCSIPNTREYHLESTRAIPANYLAPTKEPPVFIVVDFAIARRLWCSSPGSLNTGCAFCTRFSWCCLPRTSLITI
jgi:hypothetical protein